jgi:hypothetical protein
MAQTQQRRSSNGSRTRSASANGSGSRPAEALKQGAQKTTRAARKSGTPAIAAGAALAGLAAGAALASRGNLFGGRLLGGGLPGAARAVSGRGGTARTLLQASQQLNSATCSLNDLAGEIRKVRELAEAGRNRSPIEVVLQGLTRRPGQ